MASSPLEIQPKRWQIATPIPSAIRQQFPDIHPTLLQVLFNRNLKSAAQIQSFVSGRYLASDDPFLLPDMDKAVARIVQAIERDETIAVYGDFDADGVTSTVLLTEALRGFGVPRRQARPYIPDRVDEGYGLNKGALQELKDKGVDLVISVDCGVRSVKEVKFANEIGLDIIITDHHMVGAKLPPAHAIVNPQRADSQYPEKGLAGVGIAYKLAQALMIGLPERADFELSSLLDLVAIGTVADLAPLQGENRKLVIEGLGVLNTQRRPGIAALAQIARIKSNQINAESIAFAIGPRINAAGRLAHAYDAARLLAALDRRTAGACADLLEKLNRQRQRLTEELGQHAESMIDVDAPLLFAADAKFNPGVVGLVASRLTEKHYKPTIIIEMGETVSRGSCRSISEFHITDALDEISDLLVRHGGHRQAAGFTIRNSKLEAFRQAITELAGAALDGQDLSPQLAVDAELDLQTIDWALIQSLGGLEPTGHKNERPLFVSRNLQAINPRVVGRDSSHLQIEVNDGSVGYRAIAFRQAAWADYLNQPIDVAYHVDINDFRGRRTIQLQIKDIKPAAAAI